MPWFRLIFKLILFLDGILQTFYLCKSACACGLINERIRWFLNPDTVLFNVNIDWLTKYPSVFYYLRFFKKKKKLRGRDISVTIFFSFSFSSWLSIVSGRLWCKLTRDYVLFSNIRVNDPLTMKKGQLPQFTHP